jgi:Flp pilus assembly protein TadB
MPVQLCWRTGSARYDALGAMSKERAKARAVREAAAAVRAGEHQERVARQSAERVKRERRALRWRRIRLWQHGSSFHRRRDSWAALATLSLVLLLVAYLITSSFRAVLIVALILVIAGPALVMLTFERRRP